MKREAQLKSAWLRTMQHELPHYQILQLLTAGGPDRLVVGDGRSTLWEFKHATPRFTSRGNQELMCMRLAAQGFCRYVIWWEKVGTESRTLIVHPKHVHDGSLLAEFMTKGFDHQWLCKQIRRAHQ